MRWAATWAVLALMACGASDPYEVGKSYATEGIVSTFGSVGSEVVDAAQISTVTVLPVYCKDTQGACFVEPHHLLFVERGYDALFYCIAIFHELVHGVAYRTLKNIDAGHEQMGLAYYDGATKWCLRSMVGTS